ncbi:MAG: hypothetical protein VW014_00240 [Halieaceae bacterium]
MTAFSPEHEGITCRLNLNGTGTISVRSSFNVSGVTDNGTGDYTTDFSTSMSDANFMAQCNAGVRNVISAETRLYSISTTNVRFEMNESGGAMTDSTYVMIVCAGNT